MAKNIDGFVKSPALRRGITIWSAPSAALRCILSHCGVQAKYASFRRICAPCIRSFLLCRLIF